jgi:hypothetical protein
VVIVPGHCHSASVLGMYELLPFLLCQKKKKKVKQTPWSESTSKLYRPSDSQLSAKLMPTFADGGCHVVSVTDPFGRIFIF